MDDIRNDENGIPDKETFDAVCRAVSDSSFTPVYDKIDKSAAARCGSLELHRGLCQVGDLNFLRFFQNLRNLSVQSERLKGLGAVSLLHELESLFIGGARVDTLRPLAACKGLKRLTLADVRVHDGDFSPLCGLIQLEALEMSGCGVTGIDWLTGHPNLESLRLDDNPVADFGPLRTLPQLEFVGFSGEMFEPPFAGLPGCG